MINKYGYVVNKYSVNFTKEDGNTTTIYMTESRQDDKSETLTFSKNIDLLDKEDRGLFLYLIDRWMLNMIY
jgi:hypothetical protein